MIMDESAELEQSGDPLTSRPTQSNSSPPLPNISGNLAKKINWQECIENKEIAGSTNEPPARDEKALVTGGWIFCAKRRIFCAERRCAESRIGNQGKWKLSRNSVKT